MAPSTNSKDLEVASIFFGLFLGLLFFTSVKVAEQSRSIWKRTKSLSNLYLWMIWVELAVNFIFAFTTYLYIHGIILPSLAYFIGAVTLWTIQTQLLLQIIANRVSLIMVNKRKSRMIKVALLIGIGLVNISVYCIWIPALMGSNKSFIALNHIWERVEKSIFLLVDLGLNLYFLYLVRSRLIAEGLTKYWPLFNFNAAIVLVSASMDVLLLGLQNLPNAYDYVQFSPIAYIVKLHIELTMAELISKVVRSAHRVDDDSSYSNRASRTQLTSRTDGAAPIQRPHSYFPGVAGQNMHGCAESPDRHASRSEGDQHDGEGIMKTVTMLMKTDTESSDNAEVFSDKTSSV